MPADLLKLTIADVAAWRGWLAKDGASSPGVWLTVAKKPGSTLTTLTYDQALDEALCHGWIDSTGRKIDASTHVIRFTPRRAKSVWSKRNVGYIERLEGEGRMRPAGRAVVEAAKADRRWDTAYSAASADEPPEDLKAALEANPEARATWDGLNKGNRWKIYFTLLNLKTAAGRERRVRGFVDMLARGETPIPQGRKRKLEPGTSGSAKKLQGEEVRSESEVDATSRKTRSGRPVPLYRE